MVIVDLLNVVTRYNTDGVRDLLNLISEFIANPTIEVIKENKSYKVGNIVSPLLNNWEVGLTSSNNSDVAKRLIIDQLLNELKQECKTTLSKENFLVELKKYMISSSTTILNTLEHLDANSVLNKRLYAALDSEARMNEIESKANKLIEPILRNITDYMGVKEYLYRISKGLNAFKQVEFNVEIEEIFKLYRNRVNLVKTLMKDKISIDIDNLGFKKVDDLPDPKSNLIVDIMMKSDIDQEELDNTSIFKSVKSIIETLFILRERFKHEYDKLINSKINDIEINSLGVDVFKQELINFIDSTKDMELTELKDYVELMSKESKLVVDMDTDFFVSLYTEMHNINLTVSGVALVYVLMDNIMK